MTRSWNKLSEHYRGRNEESLVALGDLCQKIDDGYFSAVVYGWSSMWDLCIVQNKVAYPYDGPYLKISPTSENELEFRYVDTNMEAKQWFRVYAAAEYEEAFNSFIEKLHWVVKYET